MRFVSVARVSTLMSMLISLVAASVVSVHAQTVMGTILGTVHDPGAAIVPQAQIIVENMDTGLRRPAQTNDRGDFSVPDLPVGTYRVSVSKEGFKTEVRSGITLTVGGTININLELNVGNVSEKVEVTSDTSQVETATSSMGGLVGRETIEELPLNGRDWLQLTTLQPGVSTGVSAKDGSRGWGTAVSINGARPNNVAYRVEGLVVNDMSNAGPGSILGVNLGVDAIQEYAVLTSTYSAEYGRSGGGVVNAVLKSGTNNFHGGAVEFLRNSALDARSYFDPSVLPFRRNQFGGSIGGPVKRNKLFFFSNYEALLQAQSRTSIATTLTDAAKAGNLVSGKVTVSPLVARYLALYPSPNGVVTGDTGQYILGLPTHGREDYVVGKMDYVVSTNTNLSVSVSRDGANQTTPDAFAEKMTGNDSISESIAVTLTHSFTPAMVSNTRAGIFRHHDDTSTPLKSGANPLLLDTSLGFFPNVPMGSFATTGLTGISGVNIVPTSIDGYTSPQASEDFYWTTGRNSFKFGGNVERIDANEAYSVNNIGQWTFTSVSSFLQAKPSAFTGQTPDTDVDRGLRTTVVGAYVQDDFRLRQNLMLNLGVRYEMSTVITEVNNKLANLVNLTDTTMTTGKPLYANPTLKNFAPRIGIAWDVKGDGKTAVRAGFGMFDILPLPYIIENRIDRTYPFYNSISLSSTAAAAFPNNVLAFVAPSTARVVSIEGNPHRDYMMQFNVNVERQLANDLALKVGYSGSAGVHLPVGTDDADVVPLSMVTQGAGGAVNFPTGAGTPHRINPTWGRISTTWWEGHSTYHALLASLTKRFRRGLAFQLSYTWAHSIDNGDGTYSESQNSNSAVTPYPFIWSLNRGPSDFDVRQNLVANYTWSIPTPSTFNRPMTAILGGWQLGGIFTAKTGLPATISISSDQANTGTSSSGTGTNPAGQRPNYNPAGCPNGQTTGDIYNYINFSCYSFPALGTLGNLGRGTIRSPFTTNFDLSLSRNFNVIGDKLRGQLRAEAFNLPNHPAFGINSAKIFNGTGMVVPTTGQLLVTNSGRQIQVGLKLSF